MLVYKISLIGACGVGKTSLFERIDTGGFNKNTRSTIGAAYMIHKYVYQGIQYRLDIWDTAGQERFKNIVPLYTRGSSVVLLMYDVNSLKSLEELFDYWYPTTLKSVGQGNNVMYIIGNKLDDINQEYPVIDKYIQERMDRIDKKPKLFKISVKNNNGVDTLIESMKEDVSMIEGTKVEFDSNRNKGECC